MESATATEVSRADLRKFAWVMAGALAVFGAIGLYRGWHRVPTGLLAAAGVFLLSGLIAPAILGSVHGVWMKFAHILGWINTRLILGGFFYVILTPVSVAMRLTSRDLLGRKFRRTPTTYWQRRAMKPAKTSHEHLY
jgi:Saxitoxin biosynthesis operon protein SxtJ